MEKGEGKRKGGSIRLPQVGITRHSQEGVKREQGVNCSIGGEPEGGDGLIYYDPGPVSLMRD